MTTRLLTLLIVLGLVPTGPLVASIAGAAPAEACVRGANDANTSGAHDDGCPGQCCPNGAHRCSCHAATYVVQCEPQRDPPPVLTRTAPSTWTDRSGRGREPPPTPPPIV